MCSRSFFFLPYLLIIFVYNAIKIVICMYHEGNTGTISKKLLSQMGPAGYAPHVLVSNHQGYIGFVPNSRWVSGRHLPSSCMTLQSAPLHCPVGITVQDLVTPREGAKQGDSQVLVMLCKGHLHMYHSISGIKV